MKEKKWARFAAMAAGSLLVCLLVGGSAGAQTALDSMNKSADEAADAAESRAEGVKAKTALDAIYKVAPAGCRNWTERADNWDAAFLFNPEAPNRSEDYCDYYHGKLTQI